MKVNGSNYVLKSDAVQEQVACQPAFRSAGVAGLAGFAGLLDCWSAGLSAGLPDFGLPAMR
jgi:hypothetical protein